MQMTDKIRREKDKKSAYYVNGGEACGDGGDGVVMTGGENSKISDLDLVIAPKAIEKRYSEVVKKVNLCRCRHIQKY